MRLSRWRTHILLLSTLVATTFGCSSAPPRIPVPNPARPPHDDVSEVLPAGALDGGPVDEEPVPIVRVQPNFPEEAKQSRATGLVELQVVVDEQGYPSEITVVKSSPHFDEVAIEAVQRWRFKPATRGGVPIPVRIRIPIDFHY
jgi:TonB family protein